MRLNIINSNIIHQIIESERNIIYRPANTVFDKILFYVGYNFYIFDNNYISNSENALGLPESHIDLYSYDLFICNSLLQSAQDVLPKQLHLNSLVFEHGPKQNQIKKEDLSIINQKLKYTKKIFFDENYALSWNQHNSIILNYGIPLEIFNTTIEYDKREKDILILNIPNNMVGHQLKHHLENEHIKCDIIDQIPSMSLSELCEYLNGFKSIINLQSDKLLSLISIACGCLSIVPSSDTTSIPSLIYRSSIDNIARNINSDLKNPPVKQSVVEYLTRFHNFDLFKIKLSDIIEHDSKRKAFIL
jgi:hypothetical protein